MLSDDLRLVHTFHGPARRLSVETGQAPVCISRASSDELGGEVMLYSEADDALALIYQLKDLPSHDLWFDGRHRRLPAIGRSRFHILDLGAHAQARLGPRFDSINIRIPRAALRTFAEANGAPNADHLSLEADRSEADPMVRSLMAAFVRVLDPSAKTSRLVYEPLTLALLGHLAAAYGALRTPAAMKRGSLACWQIRRAKELLTADLEKDVSLAALSQACQLSPSHFSRAFKIATGLSPYAWLRWYRVEVAKDRLLRQHHSLAEIALRCGFNDQSHFTRAFAADTGMTPGAWRRANRRR
jgi:AraC family transcriptional regulator